MPLLAQPRPSRRAGRGCRALSGWEPQQRPHAPSEGADCGAPRVFRWPAFTPPPPEEPAPGDAGPETGGCAGYLKRGVKKAARAGPSTIPGSKQEQKYLLDECINHYLLMGLPSRASQRKNFTDTRLGEVS